MVIGRTTGREVRAGATLALARTMNRSTRESIISGFDTGQGGGVPETVAGRQWRSATRAAKTRTLYNLLL